MNQVLHKFTRKVPHWQPRLTPVDLANASQEQLDALQVTPSNTKVSDYVLTLAHDVESLSVRSPLFNAIMYDPGGMSRAERELGALGASIVNR
ncbi:MAG: alkylhydroperoxidase, partial [Roseibium sp.]